MIKIKRIYEPHAANDGYRILVDRPWPRAKDELHNQAMALKSFLP
jgi:uncharacterized protein YeaO (DUF488 family)